MNLSPNQQLIVEALENLPMAKRKHIATYLYGRDRRSKAIEHNLPRLVKKNMLIRVKDGRNGYVYKLKGRGGLQTAKIHHDITSAKALLSFKASKEGVWYGERFFKQARQYPQPEWAVLYYDRYLYMFEYSTINNFKRTDLMRKKIRNYRKSYGRFEKFFMAKPWTIFVIDAPKKSVERFAKENNYGQFYYTDLGSFTNVENGQQLDAPIYIWGGNGKYGPIYE